MSPLPPVGPGLDRIIRRNTLTLAAGLAIAWTVIQLQSALTTITTEQLTGQTAQAGIASALFTMTLGLVAIPAGRLMDRVGRGPVIALGFVVAALASAILYVAVSNLSLGLFLLAMAALGIGLGAATMARVGAADMAPPERRGRVIGRVLVGAAIGAILGPIVFAPLLSGETADVASLSTPWILAALVATVGAAVILSIRHDPLAIAKELSGPISGVDADADVEGHARRVDADADVEGHASREDAARAGAADPPRETSMPRPVRRPLGVILRQPGLPTAFGAIIVAQGVMAIAMSVVGLEMLHHGQDLGAISVALAVHIVGMFGLSPVLGVVVDRYGRQRSLAFGLVICGGGALGLAVGATLASILPAIFFVGVGWNLAFLAGNARIADATAPHERAASLGALDMVTLFTSAVMTLVGPVLLSVSDLAPVMVVAAVVAVVPAIYLVRGPRLVPAV